MPSSSTAQAPPRPMVSTADAATASARITTRASARPCSTSVVKLRTESPASASGSGNPMRSLRVNRCTASVASAHTAALTAAIRSARNELRPSSPLSAGSSTASRRKPTVTVAAASCASRLIGRPQRVRAPGSVSPGTGPPLPPPPSTSATASTSRATNAADGAHWRVGGGWWTAESRVDVVVIGAFILRDSAARG